MGRSQSKPGRLRNCLNLLDVDRLVRRVKSSGHHHSLSFIFLRGGLIVQQVRAVVAAIGRFLEYKPTVTFGDLAFKFLNLSFFIVLWTVRSTVEDCVERQPAAIPRPRTKRRSPERRAREERVSP
jgi:hypothetical protein